MDLANLIGQLSGLRVGGRPWDCEVANALGMDAGFFDGRGYKMREGSYWYALPRITTDETDVFRLLANRGFQLVSLELLGGEYVARVSAARFVVPGKWSGRHRCAALAIALAMLDQRLSAGA